MTASEPSTRWTIHGERVIDESRRLRLSIAEVELPDGVRFEQYVLRFPQAAMMVVLDEPREHVLMMWRHRFIIDRWVWELPGGYVDPDENPAVTAAREVEAPDPPGNHPTSTRRRRWRGSRSHQCQSELRAVRWPGPARSSGFCMSSP
jgi:hypothetical protein